MQKNTYLGPRLWFEKQSFREFEPGGELIEGNTIGSKGVTANGLGIGFQYDSRDFILNPGRGHFFEASILEFSGWTGSQFHFGRLRADYSTYFKNRWNHILAVNFMHESAFGNVPFTHLALLGGTNKMRGYYPGRFRDKVYNLAQFEYRAPIYKRIGATLFYSGGNVFPSYKQISTELKHAYGMGFRYQMDSQTRMNLRVDVAFTPEGHNVYFTFGEAF